MGMAHAGAGTLTVSEHREVRTLKF